MQSKRQLFSILLIFILISGLLGAQVSAAYAAQPSGKLNAADWAQIGALLPSSVSQQAYLKASNTGAGNHFGSSVAISGDTVVVGAYAEASQAGAVYVFTRSGSTWSQEAYLKASNTEVTDAFGDSVAISGDTLVVGAPGEDSSATGVDGDQADNSAGNAGAAYVFTRSGVTWSQQAYLKASNTGAGDLFGWSIAIAGDTVVVGASSEYSNATGVDGDGTNNSATSAGAAYVFTRSGVTWSQQAYLKASNTEQNDNFGNSLAISGDTVVVGAYGEDSNATGVNGNQANNLASDSGAAYVFTRSGVTWSQQAYLKASNTEAIDQFGRSVAISGDSVVVGAYVESSNATGVDGDQADNSAIASGAAYVFTRSGVTWSQQAYLKASNAETIDEFGTSVAISGDSVVVGANLEDSNATGVDGNQADNSTNDAGAAYVFTRSGVSWSQQAYLKASNTGASDFFGTSVAISGDSVVVGAYGESSNATGVDGDGTNNSASASGAAYAYIVVGPATATPTPTDTATPTETFTPTPTPTNTATPTRTITRTPTTAPNPNDLIWNQSYNIQYDTWLGVKSGNAFGQGYRKAVSGTFTFAPNTPFTQVNWITYRGPDQGKADVFVDGVLKATVNLYRTTAQWQYKVSITGLLYKKHVVVIKPLNAKSAASSGRWIVVDGFTLGSGPFARTVYDDQLIYMTNTFGYGSWFGILSPGGAFSGAYRLSNIAGATASFSFTGTQMTWVTARGPAYGKAQIWVDGALKQTVDLYRSAQQWQYKITVAGLASGTHNVLIKVLGTKNLSASDAGVVIDGFEIR